MTENSEARKRREGVIDRTQDIELGRPVVHRIMRDDMGPGILIRQTNQTVRLWGAPSQLHDLIGEMDGALEEIVNPAPAPPPGRYVPAWSGD
jgi:hypothetical protein